MYQFYVYCCRYEDDPIIGQRLYREIRKVEVKKGKGKSVQPIPSSCYQWETAATNLDEFQDVSVSFHGLLPYFDIYTCVMNSCFMILSPSWLRLWKIKEVCVL